MWFYEIRDMLAEGPKKLLKMEMWWESKESEEHI